ncbi:DUF2971 domain-containing protein [Mucilaginibacter xinganensis]|uniref:DUF2971 domain-containing protein n=1 Tax=Mucilaginibacter xinganensis TaxID=1234841 RepID=A0A223NWU4_9SPHI|nr:DUF2971 domain-containing protein [Mucilaginibacter xinganensis]ASU34260.1 hypothetical protein MuYL_2371 [Mucilaginibacter xinganensis]
MKYLDNIPDTLYKYRVWSDDYHKRLLNNNEVFFASPANLNDPFDASLPFRYDPKEMIPENITRKLLETGRRAWPDISDEELHRRAFEEQRSGKFEGDAYWKEMHDQNKAALHKTFGLLSLTTKNDNLLMWAHYANCHKGFCVGIDSHILYETVGGAIGPVIYNENFPFMPLFSKAGEEVQPIVQMLNTKSPHWGYEDEFRLTKAEAANKAFILPANAITQVILGCNMDANDRKSIIDVIDNKLPHVQIFEAKTSLESFKLEIHTTGKINK